MTDVALKTLYVSRSVLNANELIAWAKSNGFATTLLPEDMHVTVAYSRAPVDWSQITLGMETLVIPPAKAGGGERFLRRFGEKKDAVVLQFASDTLGARWRYFVDRGASWDWDGYHAHVTLSWNSPDQNVDTISPYLGEIVLGPELFDVVKEDWKSNVVEKSENYRIAKVDDSLGLVFGYAIICKVNGEPYYDLNIDRDSGARVPEHVPEDTMLKAAFDFMQNSRLGNEMHDGPDVGSYVFAFPLTTDIAKAMGISTDKTGLMVAYKPSPEVFAKFKDKTYSGFSIEGRRVSFKEIGE
jgi:hypothetical protein